MYRIKLVSMVLGASVLLGASTSPPAILVALPTTFSGNADGRLLLFAAPVAGKNAVDDAVDVGDPDSGVVVAARDIGRLGGDRAVVFDAASPSYPTQISKLPAGTYRMQAVLDRNRDYAYAGRGPGDLVSRVETVRLPLTANMAITLDHALPPAPAQFDTVGLPPAAAVQIGASREHLHDERISSPALARFRHALQTIHAWVLTPPGYDPDAQQTYPTVYTAGGFGSDHRQGGQQLSRIWHLMETGAIPPMIWVALDYATRNGTTEFANSLNNGPWGDALIRDVIPQLERRYRMDAKPSGRFLTGHSSGGWFALWTMVTHPGSFGGSWSTSPDPVDFTDFLGVDLTQPGANMYRKSNGELRPMERNGSRILQTIEGEAQQEDILARNGDGGQLRSFEWTFSPRGADGQPRRLFDRRTGDIDPVVVAYWRDRFDIARLIETRWPRLRHDLDGKVHVRVGAADSFYLDGAVRRLDAAIRRVGGRADIQFVPGASHSMTQVYTQDGDRTAYWKQMTKAMYAVARPDTGV